MMLCYATLARNGARFASETLSLIGLEGMVVMVYPVWKAE